MFNYFSKRFFLIIALVLKSATMLYIDTYKKCMPGSMKHPVHDEFLLRYNMNMVTSSASMITSIVIGSKCKIKE